MDLQGNAIYTKSSVLFLKKKKSFFSLIIAKYILIVLHLQLYGQIQQMTN